MQRKLSLAARAFLFASVPMCLILAAAFFTIHETVRAKIEQGLKESTRRTEAALDSASAEYNRRSVELLAAASEDAGLKAGIGLLREVPFGQKPDARIMKIVNDELREVGGRLDYDLFLLADADGNMVTGFVAKNADAPLDSLPASGELFPLIRFRGTLYESTVVPVNLGSENLGSLILGKKFDVGPANGSEYAALVHDQNILLTNFSETAAGELQSQFHAHCAAGAAECGVKIGGENYLAIRVQKATLGEKVQLFRLRSMDAAMSEFTGGLQRDFLLIGAGGMLILLVFSAFGSRSLSKPLTNLIGQLNEGEQTGRLRPDFSIHSPVEEVNLLGEAFNRAALAIQESQNHLQQATLEFIETMAQALDARDPYTAGHSNRVSVNSTTVADAMGLSPEEVETIRIGAKLHDIGKIGVPDGVLQKPGKLDPEEFALIRLHPQIGKRILEKAGQFQRYLPIVELHHEDFNGGGYPYGLTGDQVSLGVRIVHVADVWDALTSTRSYRTAMTEEKAMSIMESGSGTMFDPAVVEVFVTILRDRKVLQAILDEANMVYAAS